MGRKLRSKQRRRGRPTHLLLALRSHVFSSRSAGSLNHKFLLFFDVIMVSQFVGRVVILLTGGAAGAALVENTGSLGDLPRALARLLMGGGGGSDYQLNSKVRAQAAAWRRQA
jgi:hypothetical protein